MKRRTTPKSTPAIRRSNAKKDRSTVDASYDVFVSHASEDKNGVARPLAQRLRQRGGLRVWLDEAKLLPGSRLERDISAALGQCRHGVAIVSKRYLEKEWTRRELDALLERARAESGVVFVVLHGVTPEWVRENRPDLSDLVSLSTSRGLVYVADRIARVIGSDRTRRRSSAATSAKILRVACVTGLGDDDEAVDWRQSLESAVREGLQAFDPRVSVDVTFIEYAHHFDASKAPLADVSDVLWQMEAGTLPHAAHASRSRFARDPADVPARKRWMAGLVAMWSADHRLRAQVRAEVDATLDEAKPDAVVALGFGGVVAYDALVRRKDRSRAPILVTIGSPLGNTYVRGTYAGRIVFPGACTRWFDVHNRRSDALAAPLSIGADAFRRVEATFESDGNAGEDAVRCILHPAVREDVWRTVAGAEHTRALARVDAAFRRSARGSSRRRALLVGVGRTWNDSARVLGATNDVFLMSSTLQECGFASEDLRALADDRASAAAIRESLEWLLEDAPEDAERIFYFSGCGALLPQRDGSGRVAAEQPGLVAHDFRWDRASAIVDDDLAALYAQLPYETRFTIVMDCCFPPIGAAGVQVGRGLVPPDDVAHGLMRWDETYSMWVSTELHARSNRRMVRDELDALGRASAIGSAANLLHMDDVSYSRARKELAHQGPYRPVTIAACSPNQQAQDFTSGNQPFGAFTFALTRVLQETRRRASRMPPLSRLVRDVHQVLRTLASEQDPTLTGPAAVLRRRMWS